MRNPYPGPRPFGKNEYGIFAGRDHEISELTSLIVSHQVVLLYAQSGAGKTSIVNAGLGYSLGTERGIRVLPVTRVRTPVPVDVPIDEVSNVYALSMIGDLLPEIAIREPWCRRAALVDAFNRLPEVLDDTGERILSVCVIDQFEELFSVYPERWPDREGFFLQISEVLHARRDVRILIVLREDFLAAFSDLAALLPETGRTRYHLERLRRDEAIAAILKPLEGTGCSFAPDVAETVVSDLTKIAVPSAGGAIVNVPGEFVEPVYLQVVCYQLFERLPDATTPVTLEAYREFGDPDDALDGFYRKALDAARAATGVDEGELREWFDQKLITPAGTRGLVFQGPQSTGDMSNDVVRVLEEQHVIRPEIRSGSRWYELIHDRFISPIQRSNLAWKSARWSPSFEARYTETRQATAFGAGIPEKSPRGSSQARAPDEAPLRITVINGDLTFEPGALLLGHYRATQLTGTEKVVDSLIGGAMRRSLEMGVYPATIGSHQIFINGRPNLERGSFTPRPSAVIVAGLGEEGKLRPADLVGSVRQAVIAWAQRLGEQQSAAKRKRALPDFELAATLLGSGSARVGAGDAARLVAQGVHEANVLQNDDGHDRRWPRVSHLHFIELYLDRATDAWRSLRMQADSAPGRYDIDDSIKLGTGPLQRPPDSGYRGAEFDVITVETTQEGDGTLAILYTLDTRRASSEVRARSAQSRLLSELVATASNDQPRDQQIGRTLFNLLIPIELESYLSGGGVMQIELDAQTARIPWELLDTGSNSEGGLPWAIRVKLLRKLRIKRFRERVADAGADPSALVIGEPECPREYPRLFGARSEALAVASCLTGTGALDTTQVTALISDDPSQVGSNARTVVNALLERPWRIVHVAGHGMPGEHGQSGGVVLSNGTFLGPDEFRSMRTVPELVFVNCCHLASSGSGPLLNTRYDRAAFASGFAGALIEIGVRCIIAAGWAVEDDAATVFAETFYGSLLRGNRFIDAVGEARAAAYERGPQVNTWGAYQCYGDPDWVFRLKAFEPDQYIAPPSDDFSGVASATALKLALERIAVQTRFQGADGVWQRNNLHVLSKLFGSKWGASGDVAELFGEAFVEAGDVETGIRWYERAVAAPDGRASMRAAEQLASVRARLAWEMVDQAQRHLSEMKKREKTTGQTSKAWEAVRRARAEAARSLRLAVERADNLLEQSGGLLTKLIAMEQTMARATLLGSVYRRKALVDGAVGRRARIQKDLQEMKDSFRVALDIARETGVRDLYYPALNVLAADVALNAGMLLWRSLDRETAGILRQSLRAKSTYDPDFWSVVGETELDQYEALARKQLAPARKHLERAYEDLHKRVTATRMWASVYDTACLVLPNYASRVAGKEKAAANELIAQLRRFAHPQMDQ